jgi:hypothetical protein
MGGSIPAVVFLDRGAVVSDRPGETATERGGVPGLEELLKRSL